MSGYKNIFDDSFNYCGKSFNFRHIIGAWFNFFQHILLGIAGFAAGRIIRVFKKFIAR